MSGTVVAERRSAAMRDGVALATDVYRPVHGRWPTILLRTPYDRTALRERGRELDLLAAVARGYAVAFQDVRGRHASGGEFRVLAPDVEDGVDAVGWIRDQPWSDGRVVMAGSSYDGCVQLAAARGRPVGLEAVAPFECGALRTIQRDGGALRLAGVDGWLVALLREQRDRAPDVSAIDALLTADALARYHAFLDRESFAWELGEPLRHVLGGHEGDRFWSEIAALPDDPLPAFHVTGWYDSCLAASVEAFEHWQGAGGRHQQLLIGPWAHAFERVLFPSLGLVPSTAPAPQLVHEAQLRFFGAALRQEPPAPEACVATWVLGANRWHRGRAWPPPDVEAVAVALAGTVAPALTPDRGGPALSEFDYDPSDPVPTLGGVQWAAGSVGPVDQAAIERRRDLILATSGPLTSPLELAGWPSASLCVASSAVATSFVVRLTLVTDAGSFNLSQGCWSGMLADAEPERGPRGFVRVAIRLSPMHVVFPPGARVRVHVTSSDFPAVYPVPNTAWDPATGPPAASLVARQRVQLDRSWIVLPLVRPGRAQLAAFASDGVGQVS